MSLRTCLPLAARHPRPSAGRALLLPSAIALGLVAAAGCDAPPGGDVLGPRSAPAAEVSRAASASAVQARTFDVPDSIDATGAKDVTTALNLFIASVPDGAVIRLRPRATYLVNGTLVLRNRSGLTVDGRGATFRQTTSGLEVAPPTGIPGIAVRWPRRRSVFHVEGGSGIRLTALRIHGWNVLGGLQPAAWVQALEAQHGVAAQGVRGLTVDRVRITHVFGDCVYVGAGSVREATGWSRGVAFTDSYCGYQGRQGVAVVAGDSVVVERDTLEHIRRATIDLEPNSILGGATRIWIRDNHVGPGRLTFLASAGAGGRVEDVVVERNVLKGKPLWMSVWGSARYPRARFTVRDNVSDFGFGSPQALLELHYVNGVTVTGNVHPLQRGRRMTAVRAVGSCQVAVSGNQFANVGQELVTTEPEGGCR